MLTVVIKTGDNVTNIIIVEIGKKHAVGRTQTACVGESKYWRLESAITITKKTVGLSR